MPIDGRIAAAAQSELPSTWNVLAGAQVYGEPFIIEKLNAVMTKLFGSELDVATQDALDNLVVDYAGKCLALELINPAIDYWSKQPVSIGATGRNETKAWLDRSAALLRLRAYLVEQLRLMWGEVESLLPGRRVRRISNVPRVREITLAHTPNPYEFEQPFVDSTTTFGGPAETAGGGGTGTEG